MFTGLIETSATITSVLNSGTSIELTVHPQSSLQTRIGDSVAIDGTCLTVTRHTENGGMVFTAVKETLKRTTLSQPCTGRKVNLERALKLGDRLDGHLVLGHVDGTGVIESDRKEGVSLLRSIRVSKELVPYMAAKGSVAVDGISLTIASADRDLITISLIPHTLKETTMSHKKQGDQVNIECDVLARYIRHMICPDKTTDNNVKTGGESLLKQMERYGF
ncbi:riboflavin synthase subunit alpha [Chitinispirillum alkaliphilum]|nr:riboflavin synthase subunit alpha [Chitinispirillum alkaliphilum]